MPTEVGAGSTTYFADYFYTNIPASGVADVYKRQKSFFTIVLIAITLLRFAL